MKEKLLISACLTGENCKYSGGNNALPEEQLRKLRTHYELVPVCPEQLGGLPTPRTPAERRGEQVITRDVWNTGSMSAPRRKSPVCFKKI